MLKPLLPSLSDAIVILEYNYLHVFILDCKKSGQGVIPGWRIFGQRMKSRAVIRDQSTNFMYIIWI